MALSGPVFLLAALLPLAPQPAAPFPKILTDAPTIADVAPGVRYGQYEMRTQEGPLSVHVVAVDLKNPTVGVGTALASNHLLSQGEPVSSMAARTGAVAGINGDYFDINQTNQPLNILIQNGELERMPMNRWAISFDANKHAAFHEFTISETAQLPEGQLPLEPMNQWPPPGGRAVFVTPVYGTLKPVANTTEYTLEPAGGTPPFAQYRVTGFADNTVQQPPGYYLAIGPNAYGSMMPQQGDTIAITGQADPSIDGIVSAIGGGPLLVKDGAWYEDPDGPSKGEFATNMPASAVGITSDGTLLLLEVDGRQPALSVGLLQPQLAQLLIAFGVQTGMQFDGGGSSTLVARLPGESQAQVQNSPSDGVERRIADALLIFSTAPYGPPARISTMPQAVRAMPLARVPIRVAVTDTGGHTTPAGPVHMRVIPASAGRIDNGTFVAGPHPADAVVRISAGRLRTEIPVHVLAAPSFAQVLPPHAALQPGAQLQMRVQAFDAKGYPVALPAHLPWRATSGSIDPAGAFSAGKHDARVSVRLGTMLASEPVTVGEHDAALPLLRYGTFATFPHGEPGALHKAQPCSACLTLAYDFSGKERAAYADASIRLPERALGITAMVDGDGNGEILRLAVNNAINERFLYTIAKVDWKGWRRVAFRFPPALPQPITFESIYVIDKVGPGPAVEAQGAISLRDLRVVLAGRAPQTHQ